MASCDVSGDLVVESACSCGRP